MWVWVAIAGGCGAVARYLLHGAVQSRHTSRFPYGTVAVNLTGSFVLGLVVGFVVYQGLDPDVRAIVGTGFLGGYTTFSSFSYETFGLLEDRVPTLALVNAFGSTAAGLALATAGFLLASLA
jgi:CrcB protein